MLLETHQPIIAHIDAAALGVPVRFPGLPFHAGDSAQEYDLRINGPHCMRQDKYSEDQIIGVHVKCIDRFNTDDLYALQRMGDKMLTVLRAPIALPAFDTCLSVLSYKVQHVGQQEASEQLQHLSIIVLYTFTVDY